MLDVGEIMHMEGTITSVPRSAPEGVWVLGRGIEILCQYGCEKRQRQHKTISWRSAEVKERTIEYWSRLCDCLWCPCMQLPCTRHPVPEMVQPVVTKAVLWPAKAAAMHMAPNAETRPPPLILPFLLAQNLHVSSKRIAPTDNKWSKLDNAKRHHQWLKG